MPQCLRAFLHRSSFSRFAYSRIIVLAPAALNWTRARVNLPEVLTLRIWPKPNVPCLTNVPLGNCEAKESVSSPSSERSKSSYSSIADSACESASTLI